jgi:hypothetical protein
MAAQVLPSEGWIVEVQHVQISGRHTPQGARKVFGVG